MADGVPIRRPIHSALSLKLSHIYANLGQLRASYMKCHTAIWNAKLTYFYFLIGQQHIMDFFRHFLVYWPSLERSASFALMWPQRKPLNYFFFFFTLEIELFFGLIDGFFLHDTCKKLEYSLLTGGSWQEQCCISYNCEGNLKSLKIIDSPSYKVVKNQPTQKKKLKWKGNI